MNRLLFATVLAITSTFSLTAQAEISISIGQPGFYGRIDIGGYPPPRLVFPQPIIITPAPSHPTPVYLHVPPGHAKDWEKHCHQYNACGEAAYFVQDDWYEGEYVPRYQEHHGRDLDKDKDKHQQKREHDNHKREYKHEHHQKHGNNHKDKPRHHSKQNGHGHNKGNHGNKQGGHGRGH